MDENMKLTAEQVRQTYNLFDCFIGPLGGNYSLWIKDNEIISIHDDDDDDIVSVFDIERNRYVFLDETIMMGMQLVKKLR